MSGHKITFELNPRQCEIAARAAGADDQDLAVAQETIRSLSTVKIRVPQIDQYRTLLGYQEKGYQVIQIENA